MSDTKEKSITQALEELQDKYRNAVKSHNDAEKKYYETIKYMTSALQELRQLELTAFNMQLNHHLKNDEHYRNIIKSLGGDPDDPKYKKDDSGN